MKNQLSQALSLIEELRTEIRLLKNGRKSDTSSTPSSQDYGKSKRNNNSREKSDRKSAAPSGGQGGQPGHKGSNLKMSERPDEFKRYTPQYCEQCGGEFGEGSVFELDNHRQEVVIPPVTLQYIEHQSFACMCNKCNTKTKAALPSHLKANIQYGKNVHALITYLSVYQLITSNRIKTYCKDILNISISEGTIYNILSSMSHKAEPVYELIKTKISTSKVVGVDETGIKINGDKAWFWVFQNATYTFIKASCSRGYQSIIETFHKGFPSSVYVSDSLPAQLKIPTERKQLCHAHLNRELNNFEDALKSKWASKIKLLFHEAIDYKKQMNSNDYVETNQKIKNFEIRLTKLLDIEESKNHKKLNAFMGRLIKRRDSIFTFLYYLEVPPANNGSERAI